MIDLCGMTDNQVKERGKQFREQLGGGIKLCPERMLMTICGRHGIDYQESCPRCAIEERHQELMDLETAATVETIRAIRDSDYKRANPGDYECPHCRFISLKSGASRCPLCHGEVQGDYWGRVRAAEKIRADRERAIQQERAAEWERNTPARAMAARAAALKRKRGAILEIIGETLGIASSAGLLAYLVGSLGGCIYRFGNVPHNDAGFRYSLSAWKSTGLIWAVVVFSLVCAHGLLRCLSVKSEGDQS